ncbi:MAG: hypothetical protein ABI444_01970 [Candidatus Kapaibacterium sp.]|jgi:hypothetical protein
MRFSQTITTPSKNAFEMATLLTTSAVDFLSRERGGSILPLPILPGVEHDLSTASGGVSGVQFVDRERAKATRVIIPKPQIPISDTELRARVQWGHRTSSHFLIAFDRTLFQEVEVTNVIATLEESYNLIYGLTHESFADRYQVCLLDQRAVGLLGRAVQSHISLDERAIYLVRRPSSPLHTELVALLTHAMRLPRYVRHYSVTPGWSMLEDAFSIFLHCRLTFRNDIFPFFGVEPDIVAHHIFSQATSLSLANCWCYETNSSNLLRYVVAGAFFLHLGDTFSDDRVVEFSKCDSEIGSDTFKGFFGLSLEALEARWVAHLPTSLVTLTSEERDLALQRWQQLFETHK